MSLEVHVGFPVPIAVDVNIQTEADGADVLLDTGIEGIVLRIGMLGDKGIDLLRKAVDAISNSNAQMTGLCVEGLHLRIRRTRSLLRARKAQEGDYDRNGKE